MELPIAILLIIYLIIVFIFLIFTFFNLYHLWRFGMKEGKNFFMMAVYLVALLVIIVLSWRYISAIDWSQPVF